MMEITKSWRSGMLLLAMLTLVGCGSTSTQTASDDQPAAVERVDMDDVAKYAIENGKLVVNGSTLDGLFYFDFDQSIIKREGHRELNTHASALVENSDYRVRLEGHADERGTREYNNALGERRANAIRSYLMSQGVSAGQIQVISYGEEKPAAQGSNERSWALNRRVEIVYR